jgi:hypothetical protein
MYFGPAREWAAGSRPGTGRRRLPVLSAPFLWACPLGCDDRSLEGNQCAVVRTQVRGATLRCRTCGVQFTVTYYRLARAYRRRLELLGKPAAVIEADGRLAALESLAAFVEERRGRPAGSPRRPSL